MNKECREIRPLSGVSPKTCRWKAEDYETEILPCCTELGRCLFCHRCFETTDKARWRAYYRSYFRSSTVPDIVSKEIKLPSSSYLTETNTEHKTDGLVLTFLPVMDCISCRAAIILPKICRINNVRHKSLFLNSSSLSLCSLAVKNLT